MKRHPSVLSQACAALVCAGLSAAAPLETGEEETLHFEDITDQVGLDTATVGTAIARCLFADVNGDGRPDILLQSALPPPEAPIDSPPEGARFARLFLHTVDSDTPLGFRYVEAIPTNLPLLHPGDGIVLADLDNDGRLDAIITRYIDALNERWIDHEARTSWSRGRGDGTFADATPILAAAPATTSAIAVGDADRDGRLDLFLGNWYRQYGPSLEGHHNDLLLQTQPGNFERVAWATDGYLFEEDDAEDRGGRPTYGALFADLLPTPIGSSHVLPEIVELNYGRRWNRLHLWDPTRLSVRPADLVPGVAHPLWHDVASQCGIDGDSVRHGRYPEWLKERAKTDPRFDREDERPFRSNGNTFDAAVGDVDNDGDFDLFLAEITHGWAGESSDRSRFLVSTRDADGRTRFVEDTRLAVDRIPEGVNNWNQGDLFCELADFDLDGRLDLLLSSGDYPDDQRLRLFLQREDGSFEDATRRVGLDHDGSQQISLADVDGDGGLDVLVGQTFNRFTPEQRQGREPRLRLFRSIPPRGRHSIVLRLEGDPGAGANRAALGAVVRATVGEVAMQRQLIGVGGHAGKQHDLLVHFGLGDADTIDELTILWPDRAAAAQRFTDVPAGRWRLAQGKALEPAP